MSDWSADAWQAFLDDMEDRGQFERDNLTKDQLRWLKLAWLDGARQAIDYAQIAVQESFCD